MNDSLNRVLPSDHLRESGRDAVPIFRLYINVILDCNWMHVRGKIEIVPRDIKGEKSSKDTTSSEKQLEHKQVEIIPKWRSASLAPQKGERSQLSERVSVPCWHATPVANAP